MSETPFRDTLVESDFESAKLMEFQHDPNKVVRQHWLNKVDSHVGEGRDEILAEEISKYHDTRRELQQLSEVYGIKSVTTDMVVGKDKDDRTVVYTITEKIPGTSLENRLAETEAVSKEELERFYGHLVDYLQEKNKDNTNYLGDIFHNEQFVYRSDELAGQDHIYLVDVDPYIRKSEPDSRVRDVLMSLWGVVDMIKSAEEKTGYRLESVRKKVKNLHGQFLHPTKYELHPWQEIKKFIES